MKTIKDAVIAKSGKWGWSKEYIQWCGDSLSWIFHNVNELWQREEFPYFYHGAFSAEAKRLGYINGYRWGVEYPTNGKRPDLPDDVFVEFKCASGSEPERFVGELEVSDVAWTKKQNPVPATSFRVTDHRYEPADTSYLNAPTQTQSLTHSEEGLTHSDWWDYEKCEPIGYCLPSIGDHVLLNEYECVVLAKDGNAVWVKNVITHKKHNIERNNVLKPLDHDSRKSRMHREKVIGAAIEAAIEESGLPLNLLPYINGILYKLCDAGMLVLPPKKSDTEG